MCFYMSHSIFDEFFVTADHKYVFIWIIIALISGVEPAIPNGICSFLIMKNRIKFENCFWIKNEMLHQVGLGILWSNRQFSRISLQPDLYLISPRSWDQ